MKYATKFLLALVGTAIVGTAVLVSITGTRATRLLEGQIVGRLQDNASHMIEKLDQYLFERVSDAKALAADPAFLAGTTSPERTTRFLREFLSWQRRYLSAAFYTTEWQVVADTAGPRGVGQEALEGCRADLETGIDVAICAGRDSPGEEPTLRVAFVAREDGAARGVLILRLPMQVLEQHLRETSGLDESTSELHIDLLDSKGRYLYSKYESGGILRDVSSDWAFIQEKVRAGQASGSLKYSNPEETTGEEILVYVREGGFRDFAGSAWTLVLFVPIREAFAPIRALRLEIAGVVLVAAVVLLAVLFLLVRSFTRPIEVLGRAAREIGKGNLEVRVPAGSRDELGLFAETFNQMATDMQESQRELTAFNKELEGLVKERTVELLHKNEALQAELSERIKAQEALAARERLLRLNADIGVALTLGQTLEAALQSCADYIVRDLDAAFVRIWMLGDEESVLMLKASAGIYTRLDGQHSRKVLGKGKIGIIAQEQRPILSNAVLGDPAIADHEWAQREGMVAFAGHPLVVDGKTAGVMALFSRRPLEPFVLSALASVAQRLAAFIGRKRAEEALHVSEKRYRELFDSSSDGIYRTDARGVFASMNRAGAKIFGYEKPEEIIGLPALDFWRDPADRDRLRRDLEREKSVSSWRIPARKRSGEFLELETSSRMLESDDGVFLGIEGALRDVTQRVTAEAERDLIFAQLQEATANIRTLSGLLPICSGCKKIRDDKGSWSQIETYISGHSEAEFTHGLCPECQKIYFPGVTGKP